MTNLNFSSPKHSVHTAGSSLIIAFSALFLMVFSHSVAANLSARDTINLATRQSMLSQRIAKAYFFVGLSDDKRKALLQLEQSIDEFESNHNTLRDSSFITPVLAEIHQVKRVWIDFKPHLVSSPNKQEGERVLFYSDELLASTEKLVDGLISKMGKKDLGEIISLSGKQSMLSQRLAKLSYAHTWGITDSGVNKEIQNSMKRFQDSFSVLMESKFSNEDIKRSLVSVKAQSSFAQKSFNMAMQGKYLVYVIESTTDKMLNYMENITQMYAEL